MSHSIKEIISEIKKKVKKTCNDSVEKIQSFSTTISQSSRSITWTIFAIVFAFLVVIFDTVKLVRVFSLKILRGIPKEWTFELNLILSASFFFHLMGFVYAIGLPDKEIKKIIIKDNKRIKKVDKYLCLSMSAGIFIILVLIFHITSTALLIDYSPPNYLLI